MTNRTRPTRRITAQTTAVNRGVRHFRDVTLDIDARKTDHDFGKDFPVPQTRVFAEHFDRFGDVYYAPELVVTDSIREVQA